MAFPALLNRYILRQLVLNVLMAWASMSVLVLLFVVLKMAQFLEHINIDGSAVLHVIPSLVPQALFFALPISCLIGAVLTFGRLNAEGEVIGIRAAGGHPWIMVLPCLLLGLLLTGLGWLLADTWMDAANAYSRQRINAVAFEQIRRSYRPGNVVSIPLGNDGMVCTVAVEARRDGRQPINMSLFKGYEVTYLGYAATQTQLAMTLWADNCQLSFVNDPKRPNDPLPRLLVFDLDDVTLTTLTPASSVESVVRFKHHRFEIPLYNETFDDFALISSLTDLRHEMREDERLRDEARRDLAAEPLLNARAETGAMVRAATGLSLGLWNAPVDPPRDPFQFGADLDPAQPLAPFQPRAVVTPSAHTEFLKRVTFQERARVRKELEYSRKVAAAFSPLFLLLLGLGLGLMVRRQSPFVGFIVGLVGYGLLFYPLGLVGRAFTLQWDLPPLWGQFLPNFLLGGLGLLLIRWQTAPRAGNLARLAAACKRWLPFRRARASAAAALPLASDPDAGDTPPNRLHPPPAAGPTAARSADAVSDASAAMPKPGWFRTRVLEGHILGMFLTPFLGTLCGVLLLFVTLDVMENVENFSNFLEMSQRTASHGDLIPLGHATALKLIFQYLIFDSLTNILRFNGVTVLAAAVFALVVMHRARETLIIRAAGGDLRRRLIVIPLVGLLLAVTLSTLQEFAFKTTSREQNWVYERMKGKSARVAQAQTRLFQSTQNGRPVDYVLDVGRYHLEAKRALDFHLREFHPGQTWPIEYDAPLAVWHPIDGGRGRWEFPAGGERLARGPDPSDPRLIATRRTPVTALALPFSPDPFEVGEADMDSFSLRELWRMEPLPTVSAELWGRLSELLLIPALLFWVMPLQLKMSWHPAQGAGLAGLIAVTGIGLHYVSLYYVADVFAFAPWAVPVYLFGLHGLLLLTGLWFYWTTMET
ncbi:MAG: LptF/LptG family permease [Planctomycetota bacterium]